MTNASDRLIWSVDALAVAATDHLLEIGCGHGVAVSLVCERLTTGTIAAIDRSAKMVAMARNRNAEHIASGRSTVWQAALHEADFGTQRFDTIFAIHVNLFRQQAERDLGIIRRLLKPNGAFFALGQPLDAAATRATAESIAAVLEAHGFRAETRYGTVPSGSMYCVVGHPEPIDG